MSTPLPPIICLHGGKAIREPLEREKMGFYEGKVPCFSDEQISGLFYDTFHKFPDSRTLTRLVGQYHTQLRRKHEKILNGTILFRCSDKPIIAPAGTEMEDFHEGIPCYSKAQLSRFYQTAFGKAPNSPIFAALWRFYTSSMQSQSPARKPNEDEKQSEQQTTPAAEPRKSVPQRRRKPRQVCRYFNRSGGCKRGDDCRFEHVDQKRTPSSRTKSSSSDPGTSSSHKRDARARRTAANVDKVCRFFYHKGNCRFEEHCHYIHANQWTIKYYRGSRGQQLSAPPPPRKY